MKRGSVGWKCFGLQSYTKMEEVVESKNYKHIGQSVTQDTKIKKRLRERVRIQIHSSLKFWEGGLLKDRITFLLTLNNSVKSNIQAALSTAGWKMHT